MKRNNTSNSRTNCWWKRTRGARGLHCTRPALCGRPDRRWNKQANDTSSYKQAHTRLETINKKKKKTRKKININRMVYKISRINRLRHAVDHFYFLMDWGDDDDDDDDSRDNGWWESSSGTYSEWHCGNKPKGKEIIKWKILAGKSEHESRKTKEGIWPGHGKIKIENGRSSQHSELSNSRRKSKWNFTDHGRGIFFCCLQFI